MADPIDRLRRFLRELKQRNVYKVAVAYVAVAFVGLQAARLLVPPTTLPGWADDLLIYLAVFGFPIALVLAWAFEMTPEGMRRTPDTVREKPENDVAEGRVEPDASPSSVSAIVAGLTLVAVAAGAWWMWRPFTPERAEAAPDQSVAVLPFDDLSPAGSSEHLSLGLTESIIAELALVEDLSVVSRTSVMPYRETELRLPAIADSLGVEHVLEGSIRQHGDSVHITAQLIRADQDRHIWAKTYDRVFSDIFQVQSEVARRVADALEAELTSEVRKQLEEKPTENPAAYKLYLRGRDLTATKEPANLTAAIELFHQAIALDSTFALAYVGLSQAFEQRSNRTVGGPWTDSTLWAARKAVELDPQLAVAHRVLGRHLHMERGRISEAERHLKRAVALNPGGGWCYCHLAWLYYWAGDLPQSLRWYWRSLPLAPEEPLPRLGVARAMFVFRETAAARAWFERFEALGGGPDPRLVVHPLALAQGQYDTLRRRLDAFPKQAPTTVLTLQWRGVLAQIDGDPEMARQYYRRAYRDAPGGQLEGVAVRTRLAQALLASGGDSARADELLQEVIREYRTAVTQGDETAQPRVQVAAAYAIRGEREAAYRWLDSIPVTVNLRQPPHDPAFRSLHGEKQFEEWRQRARRRAMSQRRRAMSWAREQGLDWPPMPEDSPVVGR